MSDVNPNDQEIKEIIRPYEELEGALLPMLHALQEAYDYIPANAHKILADCLNISKAEIHGVISFYHDFRDKPAGKHVLKICRAEACQSVGSETLAASTLKKLGLDWHETSANGHITIEPVYCLGLCATAPAVMLDNKLFAQVDENKMNTILEGAAL